MAEYEQVKTCYGQILVELGERNPDIFVVEADLMKASGSAPFLERFADRHINVGVAEQNLVGVAAGLAAAGRIPYACTMANFISQRSCDQVAMSVSYNKLPVKLIGCYAGITQEKNGGTHISIMDLAVMRCLPYMTVIAPGDCREFSQAVAAAADIDGPVYIRMPKLLPKDIFCGASEQFFPGKAYQLAAGDDAAIISTGLASGLAREAAELLADDGIHVRVLHLPTLKPVDEDAVAACARETGRIITVEDHGVYGGLGSLVSEITAARCPVPVSMLGMRDTFGLTADLDFQLDYFGLTPGHIRSTVKQLMNIAS